MGVQANIVDYEAQRYMLIEKLKNEGMLFNGKVERAMLRVPRELFVPDYLREYAYDDTPLPIGHGQTISAPSIVAYMLSILDPDRGHKVLEIGAGSGYQAAVLAEIVAPSGSPRSLWGHVWTVEIIPELADLARRNLEKAGYNDRVTIVVGDGSKGLPDYAPYDRIILAAAAPSVPPVLKEQLKPGGRLVAPVGDMYGQYLVILDRLLDGSFRERIDIPVVFVPLRGEYGWKV